MNTRLNLVQRARAGDAAAVEELIEQSRPAVFRLALALLDDRRQADEAAQGAARAVRDGLADYSGAPAYFIWLYQIVAQVCRERLRRRRWWGRLPQRVRVPFEQIPDPPEPRSGFSQRQAVIVRMLNRLEEQQRLAAVLRYDQELQVNEIGPVLNWREVSVQTRLAEAREVLCNALLEVPRGVEAPEISEEFSHRDAQALIQGAADGLMKADENLRLKEHLEACPECRAFSGNWKALEEEIRSALHARWDQQTAPAARAAWTLDTRLTLPAGLRPAILMRAGAAVVVVLLAASLLQSLSANRAVLLPPPTVMPTVAPTPRPTFAVIDSRTELLTEIFPGELLIHEMGGLSKNILAVQPRSGEIRRLSQNSEINSFPAWSPDGQRIAFLSQSELISNRILVMNTNGSAVIMLGLDSARYALPTAEPGWPIDPRFGPPRWSPDGAMLVVGFKTGYQHLELAVVPVVEGGTFITLPVDGLEPEMVEWSPDGRMIAYACKNNREVWVWELDAKAGAENTRRIEPYMTWDMTLGLAWSPDAARLAVLTGDLNQENVAVNLRIYRSSGVLEREVMVYNGPIANPASRSRRLGWSPDGKTLAFTGVTGGTIQVIRANGSGLRTLAEFDEELGGVTWSPDGRWLAFAAGAEIWAVSLDALDLGEHALVRLPARFAEKLGMGIDWQR